MPRLITAFLGPLLLLLSACSGALPRDAVVHLETSLASVDHRFPWRIDDVSRQYGSGVYLGRGLVLTNAHVVHDAQHIQVSTDQQRAILKGELLHISEEVDLALVQLDATEADRWLTRIRFGGAVAVGDSVQALGFPGGMKSQALTSGVVSRLNEESYVHTGRTLPVIQVDAAINGGASGGALLKDGKLVGLLFQMASDRQNVGHVIPLSLVRQFLRDSADGRIDGLPNLGVTTEAVHNPMKRKRHGLAESQQALEILQASAFARNYDMRPGDLIVAINGRKVVNGEFLEGTPAVSIRGLMADYQIGDSIIVSVLRQGELSHRNVRLDRRWSDHYQVPIGHSHTPVPWLTLAGMVMVRMDDNYINSADGLSYSLESLSSSLRTDADCPQEVVVISNILPHDLNHGYRAAVGERVMEVNGARVQNFQHLNYLLRSSVEPWIEMVTAPSEVRLVFERTALAEADAEIAEDWQLPDNGFPAPPDSLSGICH